VEIYKPCSVCTESGWKQELLVGVKLQWHSCSSSHPSHVYSMDRFQPGTQQPCLPPFQNFGRLHFPAGVCTGTGQMFASQQLGSLSFGHDSGPVIFAVFFSIPETRKWVDFTQMWMWRAVVHHERSRSLHFCAGN